MVKGDLRTHVLHNNYPEHNDKTSVLNISSQESTIKLPQQLAIQFVVNGLTQVESRKSEHMQQEAGV
jgi:hypothetical protein